MDYTIKAWPALSAFLRDGYISLTNNAAQDKPREAIVALAGPRTASVPSLVGTVELSDVAPQGWAADVLT